MLKAKPSPVRHTSATPELITNRPKSRIFVIGSACQTDGSLVDAAS